MSCSHKSMFKLFIIFLIIYVTFARIDNWPGNSRLDLTRAIVDEGRFAIDTYANNTGDRAYYDGHYYSDKFPGASFLAIPSYFVFKHVFGLSGINNDLYSSNLDPLYNGMVFFVTLFTSILFSALTVILVYKTTGFFTDKKSHQYIASIAYGAGTIAFNHATLFNDLAISTFFSLFAFYIIYGSFEKNDLSRWRFIVAGLSVGFAVITTPFTGVIFVGLFFYLLFKKKLVQLIFFSVASLLVISVLFLYNFSIFGGVDFAYNHVDKSILSNDEFAIDESGCRNEQTLNNFFKKNLMVLLFNNFVDYSCSPDISVVFSDGLSFPVAENNSLGEQFIMTSYKDENYFFIRHYYVNNHLRSTFYSFINTDNGFDVFYWPEESDDWTLLYNVIVNETEHVIIDNLRGMINHLNCSLNDTLIKKNFSCDKTISTFNGVVFAKFHKQYSLINESFSGNYSVRKFNVDITKLYQKNNAFANMLKLVFYPYRGLLFFSPILLFSFLGTFYMFKRKSFEVYLVIFIFLGFLMLQSSLAFWWGGTTFGPKYLLPAIPFLFIPFVFALKKVNLRMIFLFLAISVLINLAGMQVLEQKVFFENNQLFFDDKVWIATYSWSSLGNPLLNYYFPLFFSIGPQSILLERMFNVDFPPFLNVLLLFLLIYLIILFKSKNKKHKSFNY